MAATYGRLTGRPGVCITTLGPGALNLITGAAYAHLGAMPMVMITGQKGILGSRQARFQIVDTVAAMKPLTKLTRQIVSAGHHPDAGARRLPGGAGGAARPGAPGAAGGHRRRGGAERDAPLVPPHPIEIPVAHRAALDRAAEMILAAERPLVMLGAAACRPRSTDDLAGFVRRTAHPLLHHADGQGHGARRHRRSTWAPPRSPSATTCTRRSSAPT